MQQLLKGKVIKELAKGVASMKSFLYPSVLQSAGIPVIKSSAQKNILLKYSEMSGVKLTVFLPLINTQIKHAILQSAGGSEKVVYTLVLCHSNKRSSDLHEFADELTSFCKNVVDTMCFTSSDFSEIKFKWENSHKEEHKSSSEDEEEKDEEDSDSEKLVIKQKNKIIFTTPEVAKLLFSKGLLTKKNSECYSIVLDKVDMHLAFELDQDIVELTTNEKNFPAREDVVFKTIFTTNEKGDEMKSLDPAMVEAYTKIKTRLMGPKDKGGKALVIELNEDQREITKFEKINHYIVMCKNDLDRFIILFAFKKLGIIPGKVVIMANDVIQAYRIKYFFNRFHMKAFVLSPELAKQQISSIVHFFTIGQYDILIVLNHEYPNALPQLKEVSFVVNFALPETYTRYKEAASHIDREEGCCLSLVTPDEEKKNNMMSTIQRKMTKAYGRDDFVKCIPIIWHEVSRLKSRVEQVIKSLSNKRVREEKVIEFKKQVVSNKSLKEYFKSNPSEKEILQNDI